MDCGKALALLVRNPGTAQAMQANPAVQPGVPAIAVPTTAGTGSETNSACVITNTALGRKTCVTHPSIVPRITALDLDLDLDPDLDLELALALPHFPAATCAFDLFTHATEAFTSTGTTPHSDAVALQAIRLMVANARATLADGGDVDVRGDLPLASCVAAIAFNVSGPGACHGTGHTLSARLTAAHGQTLATMMPHVMGYDLVVVASRYARIAEIFAVARSSSAEDVARACIDALRALRADLGLDRCIRDLGGSDSLLPMLVEDSLADPVNMTNPKPLDRGAHLPAPGRHLTTPRPSAANHGISSHAAGAAMDIIRIDAGNIDTEHICCAIGTGARSQARADTKKDWLRARFADGLVFRRLDARGKVFIEYMPIEKVWKPLVGSNCMVINCLWVSGQFKGRGYARQLLAACQRDAETLGMAGVAVVTSQRVKPFLTDRRFFIEHGFQVVDAAPQYFELLALQLGARWETPRFADHVREGTTAHGKGFTFVYANQCPFMEGAVAAFARIAQAAGVPAAVMRLSSREEAQALGSPFGTLGIYLDGRFLMHELIAETRFEALVAGLAHDAPQRIRLSTSR